MKRTAFGWARALRQARQAWADRPTTQQRWLSAAGLVLALWALWQWGLAPALATWRQAPAQHQQLDAQLQTMQLQAQALQALQGLPRADRARATEALANSLAPLGEQARLSLEGTQARVQFQGIAAGTLADWLSSVRLSSQAVPIEAELKRQPGAALWDGRVVLAVPQP